MRERRKGRAYLIGAALCWGLAGVCVKSVTWSTMSLMAARSLIALLMLCAVRRSFRIRLTKTNVLGAVMMTVNGLLYMQAIKMTSAGTAIVLQYIAPVLVLLFELLFRHRKAKVSEILITLAVFGGCVLSFADDLEPGRVLGNILALLAGVTYAGQILAQHDRDCNTEDSLMTGCLLSIIVCVPFMFVDQGLQWDFTNVFWVLMLGVVQYGLANIFFGRGVQRCDSVEGSLILTLEPVFNPIPVAIFCGEMMGTKAIFGAVLIIAGIALYGFLPALEARRAAKKGVN